MFPRIYSEAWQAKNIGVLEGFFSGAATTLNDRPKSASTEVFFGWTAVRRDRPKA